MLHKFCLTRHPNFSDWLLSKVGTLLFLENSLMRNVSQKKFFPNPSFVFFTKILGWKGIVRYKNVVMIFWEEVYVISVGKKVLI